MYARIQNGIVAELIADVERTQYPAPAPLPEGYEPSATEVAQRAEAQALHDAFVPGLVPISERFSPELVATMVAVPEGLNVAQGWAYAGGQFSEPPPAPLPTAAEVLTQRDNLLRTAAIRIAPLQDAVDLDDASPTELALLTAWKQYRVKLNRIELQAGFPGAVEWPPEPS